MIEKISFIPTNVSYSIGNNISASRDNGPVIDPTSDIVTVSIGAERLTEF